jgi:hypothetical protein
MQLLKDIVFDANGDNTVNFVATYNPNNGKCPPNLTMLFAMDTSVKRFKQIEIIESIPNITFHPKEKTITSQTICDMYKSSCKFKWNRALELILFIVVKRRIKSIIK